MRRPLLLAVLALAASDAFAQSPARITTVRVVDNDGAPVPYASVSVDSREAAFTDSRGMATIRAESKATARIAVRRMGYQPVELRVTRDSATGIYELAIHPLVAALDTVEVTASRNTALSRTGFYDRARQVHAGPFLGEFYGPEELESRSAGRVSEVLMTSKYARVITNGLSTMLRGRGNCQMMLLVDGRWVRGEVDDVVTTGQVMGIEVYPSSSATPFANLPPAVMSACGVVVIWTGARN